MVLGLAVTMNLEMELSFCLPISEILWITVDSRQMKRLKNIVELLEKIRFPLKN